MDEEEGPPDLMTGLYVLFQVIGFFYMVKYIWGCCCGRRKADKDDQAAPAGAEQAGEGAWTLVARQSFPEKFKARELSKNAEEPSSGNYAILDQLEKFRHSSGGFEFKLAWPDKQEQIWRQKSNPVTKTGGGVEGYQAISTPYTKDDWGGLQHNGKVALLDGSMRKGSSWFAVGTFVELGGGIPGPEHDLVQRVELYARTPAEQKPEVVLRRMHLLPKKSVATAYFLWFFGGPFGVHHFYMGRLLHGIIASWTFNFLLVGWILDMLLIPFYVNSFNKRRTHSAAPLDHSRRTLFIKFPLQLAIFVGVISFAFVYGPLALQRVGVVDIDRIAAQTLANPYETLGLSRGATLADAKGAYRKESLRWHPDRNLGCGKECEAKMFEITKAFEQIKKRQAPQARDRTWVGMFAHAGKDWASIFEWMFVPHS